MINSQAKLTGLKVSDPPTLTPPAQLLNKNDVPAQNIQMDPLPDNDTKSSTDKKQKKSVSALSDGDNLNSVTSLIGAGIAGAIATSKVVPNVGILGEGLRHVNVAATVQDLKMTDYQNNYSNMMSTMNNNMGMTNAYNGNYSNNNYNNGMGNNYNNGMGMGNNYNNGYNNNYSNNNMAVTNAYNNGNYIDPNLQNGTNNVYNNNSGTAEVFVNRARVENFQPMNTQEMSLALRNIGKGSIQGAKYGVLIGGGVSSLVNAYNVISGKENGSAAVGSVVADTLTSGLSGAAGVAVGGFASLGMGMIGIGGVPGLVLATGMGLIGAVGSQFLLQKSGIYDGLKEKVMGMFGKS